MAPRDPYDFAAGARRASLAAVAPFLAVALAILAYLAVTVSYQLGAGPSGCTCAEEHR